MPKYFRDRQWKAPYCTQISGDIFTDNSVTSSSSIIQNSIFAIDKISFFVQSYRFLNDKKPKQQKKEFALVVKNLKVLAAYAEKKGVQICVEPLNRFETDFLNTCEKGLRLIKAVNSPVLKLHLDTFHMNIEEKNQAAAIRKAGKLLGHFHACGSDRGTPGNDHIDWTPIVKALKGIRYKGDVVIESFTTDVKVIARAAAIWRRMEPTREEIAVKGLKFLKKAFK